MGRYATRTQHGLTPLLRGRLELAPDSPAAIALAEWRACLLTDLGGEQSLSQAQLTVLELACRQRWLLDQIDNFLFAQPSPLNRRKRVVLPLVRERQSVADALLRYLATLGLDRKTRDADTLEAYLAQRGPAS